MKRAMAWMLGTLMLASDAFAAALFDPATGLLTLPSVRVGAASFVDVRLALVNPATYTFTLRAATAQEPAAAPDITFDATSGMLKIPFVSVGAAAYSVTMQLVDAASYTFTLSTAELVPAGSRLYIGYYVEDAATNPEDPTVGSILLSLPTADAAFAGLMPFSYVGCSGQADIGTVSGNRSAARISGSWTGTVDRIPVGGSYVGDYDVVRDIYTGTFANTGGKVRFGSGSCVGYVAPRGTWKAYSTTTNEPASFAARVGAGVTPTISWPSAGSAFYVVRVFDEACLTAAPQNPACFKGETLTAALSLSYPAQFPGATPMAAGGSYLVIVTAQQAANQAFLGFSSVRHRP